MSVCRTFQSRRGGAEAPLLLPHDEKTASRVIFLFSSSSTCKDLQFQRCCTAIAWKGSVMNSNGQVFLTAALDVKQALGNILRVVEDTAVSLQ